MNVTFMLFHSLICILRNPQDDDGEEEEIRNANTPPLAIEAPPTDEQTQIPQYILERY